MPQKPLRFKFFRKVEYMYLFYKVSVMNLEYVKCETTEDSSTEHDAMCHKGSKI
jgi:hypothetical protein